MQSRRDEGARDVSIAAVTAWLRKLGLERYAEAFSANDIDAPTLTQLTEADLASLGVKSVGHRRKLMDALATLGGPPHGGSAEAAAPARPDATRHTAERRQLSVLYCDMVDSTALSARLDPEDMREVIRSFHGACLRLVAEYDGHVANFIGDCMLVYFGWPRAHEDDAERAVRAGLAMLQTVDGLRLPSGESLSVRAGIATGPVVVGDLIRHGPAQEQSAVGVPPNLAQRLQTLAAPGELVVDELTRRLLPTGFAVRELGEQSLKGMAQAVPAYSVGGELSAGSRFDARTSATLPPMIGRDQELALILERWEQARAGEGTAILLVGEAGIGKSRIVRAMLDACADEAHVRISLHCSPYHSGSALWPVVRQLSHAIGLRAQDPADAALDRLEAFLGPSSRDAAPVFAALLGLDGSRYGALELSPQMLRARTRELLVAQLFALAQERPLLLVVEDAHWIDPTTLELIDQCLGQIDAARCLILLISRPDQQPSLAAHPSVTRLTLNRLSRASVEAIVARLSGDRLQAQTLATIVAQTDGVPLFVEELTKAVMEAGEAAIPASLHGSLMARLDRLPGVKEVAQLAACIGREFDHALVHAIADHPQTVRAALDKLTAAELVFRSGGEINPRFIFKHALVQQATCDSLLRGKRQEIHARVLQELQAQRPDTPPEILAHHAMRAGQTTESIGYWWEAGKTALAASAYVEATGHIGNAVSLVESLADDGEDRRLLELELQLRLGQAHVAAGGFGPETTKAFHRAYELIDADRERAFYFPVLSGLWAWHNARGNFRSAMALAQEVSNVASEHGDDGTRMLACRMVGSSALFLGELVQARDELERGLALVEPHKHGGLVAHLGMDLESTLHQMRGWALYLLGFPDQGGAELQRGLQLGYALTQINAKIYTLGRCCVVAMGMRDGRLVEDIARRVAELAAQHRIPMYRAFADIYLAWAAMEQGRHAEAAAGFERGLADLAVAGSRLYLPFFLAGQAAALAGCGRHDEALRAIDQAIVVGQEGEHRWCEAELWRVRGEVLAGDAKAGDRAEALRSLERALSVARRGQAKLWELRAATTLARLLSLRGDHSEAKALLAPLHEWFTEGHDTVDLRDARRVLEELGTPQPS